MKYVLDSNLDRFMKKVPCLLWCSGICIIIHCIEALMHLCTLYVNRDVKFYLGVKRYVRHGTRRTPTHPLWVF